MLATSRKGFGILELATLDPKDASEVAKQIAFEQNVPLRATGRGLDTGR